MVGTNYWDVAALSHLDENTSELKGTATSILNILDKMDLNGVKYKLDVDKNSLIKDWRSARQLLLEYPYDPHMGEDKSSYKVKVTRC